MARVMSARAAAARRAEAVRVRAAAEHLAEGQVLDEASRTALVELLEHLAFACETVGTTIWDRVAALALRIREPHRPLMSDFPVRSATGDSHVSPRRQGR